MSDINGPFKILVEDYTAITTSVVPPDGQKRWYNNGASLGYNASEVFEIVGNGSDDIATLSKRGAILLTAQTFYGVKTFDSFPISPSGVPSSNYQFANKLYADTVAATPPGTILDFSGPSLPSGYLWVRKTAQVISQTTYANLWSAYGSVDWYAPDAASAATAAGGGNFYMPGLRDLSTRGPAIHGVATFDNATDLVTITDVSGDTVNDDWRDGTPIRFIDGTMPTGITEYTTYYLHWDSGNSAWDIWPTESEAIAGSGSQVTFTTDGSGVYATQFGISLADAFQGHSMEVHELSTGYNASRGSNARTSGASNELALFNDGDATSDRLVAESPISDGTNGTPRLSNETRGRTGYMRKIIKV